MADGTLSFEEFWELPTEVERCRRALKRSGADFAPTWCARRESNPPTPPKSPRTAMIRANSPSSFENSPTDWFRYFRMASRFFANISCFSNRIPPSSCPKHSGILSVWKLEAVCHVLIKKM